ncbi:MAG: hypothetical protein JJU29_15990 [Verrucomicrobia bacterium]|nr:hypothetical protein [Verrucomicrobiota bacterium]MCH8512922.1 hypothetical protein [Kiritimatiellia bacterium]
MKAFVDVTESINIEIPAGEGLPELLLQFLLQAGAEEFARSFSGGQVVIRSARPVGRIPVMPEETAGKQP